MEELLNPYLNENSSWLVLIPVIVFSIATLGKGADWLVKEAVALSLLSGLPKVIIGATVVSLGTTCPEAAVSVMSAIHGDPGMALGNAVGSVICDSGLILGLAAIITPLPLDPAIVNRQGWIQVSAGFLLVASCWPLMAPLGAFDSGGELPQSLGFFFLILLGVYMWLTIKWARDSKVVVAEDEFDENEARNSGWVLISKLLGALAIVILSSTILLPAVKGAAVKIGIHQSIIAATLVAFGTSLPELVTAMTAVMKGHGELAVGNVIGADILNVLFVAGAAAAVTPGGLKTEPHFFYIHFPVMILVLIMIRVGMRLGGNRFSRASGIGLLAAYLAFLVLSFALGKI